MCTYTIIIISNFSSYKIVSDVPIFQPIWRSLNGDYVLVMFIIALKSEYIYFFRNLKKIVVIHFLQKNREVEFVRLFSPAHISYKVWTRTTANIYFQLPLFRVLNEC